MNWFLGIDATSGVLVADFEDTGGTQRPQPPGGGTTVVTSNVWHHAAATYDATTDTWRLYLDGVLDGRSSWPAPPTPEATSIQHAAIGTSLNSSGAPANTGGFFAGVIDEVRIWNVARSTAEIQATKNDAITGVGTACSPAGASREGSGSIVGDTASEFDGTPSAGRPGSWASRLRPPGPTRPRVHDRHHRPDGHEGDVVSLDADATDADSDSLTYSATGLPAGLTINANSGCHQRHARRPAAPAVTRHADRVRRLPDRHRHLHADRDCGRSAAGRADRPDRHARQRLGQPGLDREHRARPRRLPRLPRHLPAGRHHGQRRSTARRSSTGTSYLDSLPSTARPTSTWSSRSTPPATARRPPRRPARRRRHAGTALQLDGTNDYVTFGARARPRRDHASPSRPGSAATAPASATRTGTGGITTAVPLVTKGRAEAETPANLNMNYFLGIDTTTDTLVADFEDTTNGGNHPVTGITAIRSAIPSGTTPR